MENLFYHNELLLLSVIIVTGMSFAWISKKFKLPKVTGYIAAGMILGKPLLNIISEQSFESFKSINVIALSMMSVTIGAHLNYHKLKNSGKRVISVLLFESTLTFIGVSSVVYFFTDLGLIISLLIGSIAIETGPAATVAVVKDTKSKGLLVNTIMPVVAMNNVLCILVFGVFANVVVFDHLGTFSIIDLIQSVMKELILAIILGVILGLILTYFAGRNISSNTYVLSLFFLTILAVAGISKIINVNAMLPSMFVGIVVTNFSYHRSKILSIFEEIGYIVFIIFFALAGAHIDMSNLLSAGIIGLLYFLARSGGKIVGGFTGAYLAGTSSRIYKYIGTSLLPHAGVAIGLIIVAADIEALKPHINFITTLVLAVVGISEILGPPLTRWSLEKGGDANNDRPKLIEFLLEEYINPSIKSKTKDDALKELVEFFSKTHKCNQNQKNEILKSVFERETDGSTGVGHGIAIPHAVIDKGPVIWGAIGLSTGGIEWDSFDEKPVHLIVLVVTPKEQKHNMHLEVMAEIAKILSDDSTRTKLFKSRNAFEVVEVFREKEMKEFSYFIDEVSH
ncbi:MAG: PTS sugar transporter subunit IIA [Candidatus Delongbacteria bacterium]|nr:PTS sugar transporter subunit IIA [Candidatus Delongbacteria bacterium]MBN2835619.1 PTS sugar transporter subunit IIA [Candidatus Delongbacteria bacterium]